MYTLSKVHQQINHTYSLLQLGIYVGILLFSSKWSDIYKMWKGDVAVVLAVVLATANAVSSYLL